MTEPATGDTGPESGAFTRAVCDVLADEPAGLEATAIRRRIHRHPDHDLEVRMQDLHGGLGALLHSGTLTYDQPRRRYVLSSARE